MHNETDAEVGRVDPATSTETDNPWGVCFTTPQTDDWDPVLKATADLGVSYARITPTTWQNVEPEPGEYDWSRTDQVLGFMADHGIEPYARVGLGNPAYDDAGGIRSGTTPPFRDEETYAAWREFLPRIVERYVDEVTYWEMPNEPNVGIFWQPEPDAVELARYVREAEELIEDVTPDAKLVGGVLAGLDVSYTREFLAAGGAKHIDVFCYHAYQTLPEAYLGRLNVRAKADIGGIELDLDRDRLRDLRFESALDDLEGVLRKRGFDGPLWQGETGYPSTEDTIHWRGEGPWGERIQAKFALRRLLTDWFAGAEMSAYFPIIEFSTERGSWGFHEGKNTKGLLVLENLRRKPAFDAIQHLCTVLDRVSRSDAAPPTVAVRDLGSLGGFEGMTGEHQVMPPVMDETDNRHGGLDDADVRAEAFRSASDRPAAVYWVPQTMQEREQAGTADLRMPAAPANPLLVDLVDGVVLDPGQPEEDGDATVFEEVPLTDYPLALVASEDVPLA